MGSFKTMRILSLSVNLAIDMQVYIVLNKPISQLYRSMFYNIYESQLSLVLINYRQWLMSVITEK